MGESHSSCTTRSPGSVRWQCGDLVGQRASKVLTHGIVHFYHQNGLIDLRMMEGYGIAGTPDPDRKRGLLHAGLSWAPRSAVGSAGAAGSPESRGRRRGGGRSTMVQSVVRRPPHAPLPSLHPPWSPCSANRSPILLAGATHLRSQTTALTGFNLGMQMSDLGPVLRPPLQRVPAS